MPPLESRLGLRIHEAIVNPRWNAELSVRIVDNQDRVASSLLEGPTPGFTVWDLRAFWQVNKSILLLAGIENFTDKSYREYLDFRPTSFARFDAVGVRHPGISFYFGTEVMY